MRHIIERLLQSVDPPNPERAERLWAEYRANGPKADTAFATLLAWYGGPIYRRIWGFVRSDTAEDVLTRLHRRRHRFADFEHALRWLRGVAVTQSLNARRGDKRRVVRERIRSAASETVTATPETAELGEALRAALGKLYDREREAVALVYFEGMTRQDAAVALGVHRDTLAKLLDTTLSRLRTALATAAVGTAATTATVEAALAINPGLALARLSGLAEAVWADARGPTFVWPSARRLVPLILAGGLVTVAAYALYRSLPMPRQPVSRLQVERLEPREVPSASFQSALSVGNATGGSQAQDVWVDTAGNRYLTGTFSGTTDFDPARTHTGNADILTSVGANDAYVAKYAADDSLVWARRMGGNGSNPSNFPEAGRSIAVDAAGNVYVSGDFHGTADFGSTTLVSAGPRDGFVTKLTASGEFAWVNKFGAVSDDWGLGVGLDADGNVYALGYRLASAPVKGYDVLKFSPTGTVVWSKWFATRAESPSAGLVVSPSGDVFVAGRFYGTVDFDPGPKTKSVTSGYYPNAFVLKLTSAGNFGWVAPFVGQGTGTSQAGFSSAESITLDATGNVIVSGSYGGPVDFNSGNGMLTLPPAGGGFVAKLNSSGGLTWAKSIEKTAAVGSTSVSVYGLDTDAAGNVYTTGSLGGTSGGGTADFDPGAGTQNRTTAGGNDAFVLKWTSTGDFGWVETFGSTGNDIGRGIALDSSGQIHLVGTYTGTVDFDPDPSVAFDLTTPGTFANFFLVKLRPH